MNIKGGFTSDSKTSKCSLCRKFIPAEERFFMAKAGRITIRHCFKCAKNAGFTEEEINEEQPLASVTAGDVMKAAKEMVTKNPAKKDWYKDTQKALTDSLKQKSEVKKDS